MKDFYTRKDISNDTVEFTVVVPEDEFKKEYSVLLKKELESTDIKGFRKGKVPSDFVEPHVGNTLKVQAFEKLVPMLITTALQEENLEPIAPPEYKSFPDFKEGSEMSFTMSITVMPDFKLGNLKKVKVKKEEPKVEDKEVDEALENINNSQESKSKDINDDWAKEVSKKLKIENIKDLKSLKSHIKDLLAHQKEHMLRHKLEDDALIQAISISKIEVPELAVKFEAEERERAFVSDMQQKGIKVEDFLKANNITIEKMRELWLKDAKQALESDVFLRIYIKDRGIKVSDEDLKKRIDDIKKGAPEGTDEKVFENEQWKEYIRRIEEKEMAFQSFIKEVLGE